MNNSKDHPLITIGIPTFNRAEKLLKTLKYILLQDYYNLEVIVCDNNSTDDTKSLVLNIQDNRINYYRNNKNIGMRNNFNECLSKASGKFFILLSDDDIPNYKLVSLLFRSISSSDKIIFAYSKVEFFKNNKSLNKYSQVAPKHERGIDFIKNNLFGIRSAFPSASILRVNDIRDINGYPDIDNSTDFGLLLKLCLKMEGLVSFINKPLIEYHEHGQNLSLQESHVQSLSKLIDWIKVILKDHQELLDKALLKYKKDLIVTFRNQKIKDNTEVTEYIKIVYFKNYTNLFDRALFFIGTNQLTIIIKKLSILINRDKFLKS